MPSPEPSSLLAELATLDPSKRNRTTCGAAIALGALEPDVRSAVYDILDNRLDINTVDLVKVLERHGVTVRAQALRRHRKRSQAGGCTCPRETVA